MTHRIAHWKFVIYIAVLATAVASVSHAQVTGGSTSPGSSSQAPAMPAASKPKPVAPVTSSPATQGPQWKNYSYASDGFSVAFPTDPTMQKQSVPTAAGTFELRTYLVTAGQAALYVAVCDYGTVVNGKDPQTILDGAKEGALSNAKAHALSSSNIKLGVYPGETFEAESDALHFSVRIYLVGTTLYQTLTAYPLGPQYDGVTKFLDSFLLIPRASS